MRFLIPSMLLMITPVAAQVGPIPIWPHGAPGEAGKLDPEADTTTEKGNLVAGRRVIRLGNVSNPAITVYRAPKDKATGAAVVVFPGGGYRILAMDLEGTEVCAWLNSIGVTGVLLKYRVPAREGGPRWAAPLADAQRAMGLVRTRAAEWGIDPRRIGVLGFSAGGHLAAALSNNFERRSYEPADEADRTACRPDFSILIYPAYLTGKEGIESLAAELNVTPATPPAFLVQTQDDNVRVENSIAYFLALKKAKVPVEMHLFSSGGHGYGLRRTEKAVTAWPEYAARWLASLNTAGNK